MNLRNAIIGALVVLTVAMQSVPVDAGGLGKAVARGATKSASKAFNKGLAQKLRRDLLRDRKTPARVLKHDRHVFRYTTKAGAEREIRNGLRPGTHMTTKANAGRPLSAASAKQRFGLPKKPQVRETIHLSKGQPVRNNRALGGQRGVGETTSSKRIPSDSIEKVVPLR
jgi:hypothetical protein